MTIYQWVFDCFRESDERDEDEFREDRIREIILWNFTKEDLGRLITGAEKIFAVMETWKMERVQMAPEIGGEVFLEKDDYLAITRRTEEDGPDVYPFMEFDDVFLKEADLFYAPLRTQFRRAYYVKKGSFYFQVDDLAFDTLTLSRSICIEHAKRLYEAMVRRESPVPQFILQQQEEVLFNE